MLQAHKIKPLSPEQRYFLANSTAQINICHGPVRSGKNFVENLRLLRYFAREPVGDTSAPFAFCGASADAIYDIFLSDLFDMLGPGNWTYEKQKGKGTIYGRRFKCYPCQSKGDFKALRGKTLGGGLITEGTLCDQDFFNELLARCSIDGAKIFVDTNPGGPFHWLATDYIFNEEKLASGKVKAFGFNFDSNKSLKEAYKEGLRLFYGPGSLWYQRMIEGLWVMADGVIYAGFTKEKNTLPPDQMPTRFDGFLNMGLDYGTTNPLAALIGGVKDGVWYITREHYHNPDPEKKGIPFTDSQHAEALVKFISKSNGPVSTLYIDPSAASMRAELLTNEPFLNLGTMLRDADNDVLSGIALMNSLITSGKLIFSTECKNALREIGSYVWDPLAQKKGEDKPKKENDHAMDACRYLVKTETSIGDPFSPYGLAA